MQRIKNIKWLGVLMGITILGITAFQVYWLQDTYEREKKTLEIRSNMTFRETVHSLQATKLHLDNILADTAKALNGASFSKKVIKKGGNDNLSPRQKMIALADVLKKRSKLPKVSKADLKLKDSSWASNLQYNKSRIIDFLYEVDSMQDTLSVDEIKASFATRMEEQSMMVPFFITKFNKEKEDEERVYNEVNIGFSNPVTYRVELGDTSAYLLRRIATSILLSLFIVGFTTLSFVLLYRNLLKQRKLTSIKNEFISNITHELKTPIATVSVAIEALRTFNANIDTQRTKEYLDISANELLRLSLLVDKVLKLSMFEKKEVDLKYEPLDMENLIEEVTSSMRLQFEKHKADVSIETEGNTHLEGDRLHLVSVLYNLLDNALKYSPNNPQICIKAMCGNNKIKLSVADNGIGIPDEYKEKVFEKFFRVPTGNLHNAKGYGLGLSYVAQVVQKHKGNIRVESVQNRGSKFIINLPKQQV